MFKIFDIQNDKVIDSVFVNLKVDYEFALNYFFPRINNLDFQRNVLNNSHYNRLKEDIVQGCIMPPITIGIVDPSLRIEGKTESLEEYICENNENIFVLDGIQRLSTLKRASQENGYNKNGLLYANILICDNINKLLYRLITLNNGQKAMSARHQIEILTSELFERENFNIEVLTEKNKNSKKTSLYLNKDDVIKAYIAFMSNSVNIDNQKIIAERMDKLLIDKILDSNLHKRELEFTHLFNKITRYMNESEELANWFKVSNNLIGYTAAYTNENHNYYNMKTGELERAIINFENAFHSFNVSKIQLGKSRRRLVKYFFENYVRLDKLNDSDLLEALSQEL